MGDKGRRKPNEALREANRLAHEQLYFPPPRRRAAMGDDAARAAVQPFLDEIAALAIERNALRAENKRLRKAGRGLRSAMFSAIAAERGFPLAFDLKCIKTVALAIETWDEALRKDPGNTREEGGDG